MFRISKKFSTLLLFVLPFTTSTLFYGFLNPQSENQCSIFKMEPSTRLYVFYEDDHSNKNQEYTKNLGKTLDILDMDYQNIFKQIPNFDIYTENITLRDPSGIRLQGLPVYKNLIEMVYNFANLFIKDCFIDYHLTYRPETKKAQINWKLKIHFRLKKIPFYIQASSIYDINKDAKIYNHIIDKLIINDKRIRPPYTFPSQYMKWIFDKKDSKRLIPSLFVHFQNILMEVYSSVFEKLEICQTNEDCSFPLTCCHHSFFKTCCKEGGTPEKSYYPHPYFKRPVRVKAHYND